jgi:hypothetical protein
MAMTKLIIAIAGFKGSGKDTVGAHLAKNHDFEATSFAKPLKRALCEMFGWKRHMLEGKTAASRTWREQPDEFWSEQFGETITPRYIMQYFGTDVVRKHMLDSFWINSTKKEIMNISQHVVITDARFQNELSMVKHMGGITIRVVRGPEPEWFEKAAWLNKQPKFLKPMLGWLLPEVTAVHESERDWIGWNFDYTIQNDQDLAHLISQVNHIVDEIKLSR